jgi:hypothetical protein
LQEECFICQPSSFLRREVLEQAGGMDPNLHYTFDYELWMRIARTHTMRPIDEFLSCSRMHRNSKTVGQRGPVLRETLGVLRRHYGYVPFRWIHSHSSYLLDKRDQFFEPMQPTIPNYVLSLFTGLLHNWRHPVRFTAEWAAVMSWPGLARQWRWFLESHRRRRVQ